MQTTFEYKPFSKKQRQVLNWWTKDSPVSDADGIIADGAIRSGKSLTMSLSFVLWAMCTFNGQNFAMCGKTVGSFRKNVLHWLKVMLDGRGISYRDCRSENLFIVQKGERENFFYIYGGKDERSQDLIQGITLAGLYLDEVVLMPESFVNQATGRCSVAGSKIWFNCNPAGPSHWFKTNWIDCRKEKNLLYLHFMMDDNLSLDKKIKERYKSLYTGMFYERYIEGKWVLAEGMIYPMYQGALAEAPTERAERYVMSLDYGTQNAFAALIWGKYGAVWHAIKGYYYSGRETGRQKTDKEYADDLDKIVPEYLGTNGKIKTIVDPSAASFIAELRRRGRYAVIPADNAVADGIRETASAMEQGKIKIDPSIREWETEAAGYIWLGNGDDVPVKENDHYMDSTRYFVKTERIVATKKPYNYLWNE